MTDERARDPSPPEVRAETYALSPREFEVIRLLRRMHLFDGSRGKWHTALIEWDGIHIVVKECVQISGS